MQTKKFYELRGFYLALEIFPIIKEDVHLTNYFQYHLVARYTCVDYLPNFTAIRTRLNLSHTNHIIHSFSVLVLVVWF